MMTLVPLTLLTLYRMATGELDSIRFESAHLFSLTAEQTEVLYRNRPTPCLAVDSRGNIPFPARKYTITIYSPAGRILSTLIDSTVTYPKRMLFDENDVLQVMDQAERRIIKHYAEGRREYPCESLEDWWRHSDKRITQYLAEHQPDSHVWKSYDPKNISYTSLSRFTRLIDILVRDNKIYVNGRHFVIYEGLTGTEKMLGQYLDEAQAPECLLGVLNEHVVIVGKYDPCLLDVKTGRRRKIDLRGVVFKYNLQEGWDGNGPETNKLNIAINWYWQRNTNNVYRVAHRPKGFIFIKVAIH